MLRMITTSTIDQTHFPPVPETPRLAFQFARPADWINVPLNDADFQRFLDVRLRTSAGDTCDAHTRAETHMRTLHRQCRDADISLLMTHTDLKASDGQRPVLAVASCTISVVPNRQLGAPRQITVERLHAELDVAPRSGTDRIPTEPVVIIDLPGGRAVRRIQRPIIDAASFPILGTAGHASEPGKRRSIPVHIQQYYMPVNGGRRIAVMTFNTPNSDTSALVARFEAMAATFRPVSDRSEPAGSARG